MVVTSLPHYKHYKQKPYLPDYVEVKKKDNSFGSLCTVYSTIAPKLLKYFL